MELDWERALQCRMGEFILKQGDETVMDNGEMSDEVLDVFEVFWNHS
tara:strand:- start:313 stop:453 length:141 start_codon:yes stop_codon:yes gene_type:complete